MRTVDLKKWGNSLAVRLPKTILSKAGISELPAKFDITVNKNNEIILKKQKEPESLKELFKGFDYEKYWSDWEKKILVNLKKKTGEVQLDEKYFNLI